MNSICIIVNKYPNKIEPSVLVFVQQLAWSMADQNIKVSVICPLPINININYMSIPHKITEITENNNEVEVYFPKFIGFGQSKKIFGKSPAPITTHLFTKSVRKVISKMKVKPDVVYGHFVTPSGICTSRIGKEFNIPSFMAHGEATPNTINQFGVAKVKEELKDLNGIIAVSSRNKDMLVSLDVADENKIEVFPNSYRPERFYPRDKRISREKFGFEQDDFIIGFVGSFDDRKGILRLENAVESIDNVKFACAGKGKLVPTSEKCIFSSPIDNKDLPYFYSAIDIFVLPTRNEGCCNAIIEALACGIPIISSNKPFNDEILDSTCSIKIDPENVDEIREAIKKLYEDVKLRQTMAKGSIEKAKTLTLERRAQNIIKFIRERKDR